MNTLANLRYPIARIAIGAIFFILGLMKITTFAGVATTRAIEVGAGLLLIIGKQVRLAALALALFIVPVTLVFHGFWSADAASFQDQLTQFLKNLAIFGGMLLLIDRPVAPKKA